MRLRLRDLDGLDLPSRNTVCRMPTRDITIQHDLLLEPGAFMAPTEAIRAKRQARLQLMLDELRAREETPWDVCPVCGDELPVNEQVIDRTSGVAASICATCIRHAVDEQLRQEAM